MDPLSSIDKTIQTILSKKWQPLLERISTIENGKSPGVYLLAFSNNDLTDKAIDINDIFYVGMSNAQAGVKSRLTQFIKSIGGKKLHSAGMRFFKHHSNNKPFDEAGHNKKFYMVAHTFKCMVVKKNRTSSDLRTMGDICQLEYYLLAYVKEHKKVEPELNKK